MPLFDSFSKIFASLSPHRPRHTQPDDSQPSRRRPQSSLRNRSQTQTHDLSDSPTRGGRTIKHPQNQFSLLSNDEDHELDISPLSSPRDTAALPQSTQSYANTFDFPPGSKFTRRQLRSLNSQSVVDSGDRLGDTPQMSRKDQYRNSRTPRQDEEDEFRLLGGKHHDAHAVRIRPGELKPRPKPKPGSSAAFKPTDKLSRNSRESGPVRSQGKGQSSSLPSKKSPRRDDVFDLEQYGSSSKRPRHNDHRLSPVSIGSSRKPERNGLKSVEQFREVERNINPRIQTQKPIPHQNKRKVSPVEDEESFTEKAAKQRRGNVDLVAASSSKRKVLPTSKSKLSERLQNSRDSPDELQGDVTTRLSRRQMDPHCIPAPQTSDNHLSLSPSRKRSPTDIQPTDFSMSSIQGNKKSKRNHIPSPSGFQIDYFRYGQFKKQQSDKPLAFHINQDRIELTSDSNQLVDTKVLLHSIISAVKGDSTSRKFRLKLARKNDSPPGNVDIEFKTISDKDRFTKWADDQSLKVVIKPAGFMDSMFDNDESEMAKFNGALKENPTNSIQSEPVQQSSTSAHPTHQKLSSALQGGTGNSSEDKSNPTIRDKSAVSRAERVTESDDPKADQPANNGSGVEIPIKKFQPKVESERQTRSTRQRSTRISDLFQNQGDGANDPSDKYPLKDDPFRKNWKRPLVYPQNGKKKAEVTVEDRDRLRDDEFLNDNLIAFYMRFLQDHLERTNPEAAKKVYFFNSYFYDTLTKTSRGQRGINYSGVAKWTRNVDLFSYDYVVVPINQNAHWYVAIICNLPKLLGETEAIEAKTDEKESATPSSNPDLAKQTESEVHEILESPEPESVPDTNRAGNSTESPPSQAARTRLASMSLQTESESDAPKGSPQEQGKEQLQDKDHANENDANKDEKEPTSADEWPVEDEHHPSPVKFSASCLRAKADDSVLASQASNPKKKGKAGQKFEPSQTMIITFDSLDLARSPTIKMLRDYICEESVSKRGKEVDPKDIKGMRARQIPLQPNFSDCGLYLLAYLEKFAQYPEQFITKLLRREMDEKDDWPPLGSGLLRQRLRDFLDQLYQEQERVRGNKSQEEKILADQQPISYLLGPSSSSETNFEQKIEEPPKEQPKEPPKEPPKKSENVSEGKEVTRRPQESQPNKSELVSEKKEAPEKLSNEPHGREAESSSDSDESSAVDQLQLVPTGVTLVTSKNEPSARSAAKDIPDANVHRKKDEDVVEVPDSQETKRPEPQPIKAEKTKSSKVEGNSKEKASGRKKANLEKADDEVVLSDDTRPNKPVNIHPKPRVEIQVRETPPPPSPERVRKSPRRTRGDR